LAASSCTASITFRAPASPIPAAAACAATACRSSQLDDLTAYGCDKIFTDKTSGKLAERPELDKALAYLRAGDVLVITRLSRAMRSLKHLLALADELRERGVDLDE
jgi:DNA invertase Pin-like site-specific DNA recombinase